MRSCSYTISANIYSLQMFFLVAMSTEKLNIWMWVLFEYLLNEYIAFRQSFVWDYFLCLCRSLFLNYVLRRWQIPSLHLYTCVCMCIQAHMSLAFSNFFFQHSIYLLSLPVANELAFLRPSSEIQLNSAFANIQIKIHIVCVWMKTYICIKYYIWMKQIKMEDKERK